ncbi:hypothetical protein FQZ97_377130 [compost metagenome]
MIGKVRKIWRYAVKSMGGERLMAFRPEPRGLRGDRARALHDDVAGEMHRAKSRPAGGVRRCCYLEVRTWWSLAALLLQLLMPTNAFAQDLHAKVCSAAVQLMVHANEAAGSGIPQIEELRALQPQLDGRLRPTMRRLVNSMESVSSALATQRPLLQQQYDEFNNALLDTLALLRPTSSLSNDPLVDLPERLDFALVLYISWSSIGILRPARERNDGYLGWDVPQLAGSIEQDLMRDDWLQGANPEEQRLLADARSRWKYISKLLHRATTDPAPWSMKKQIDRIREDLLKLRAQRSG